MRYSVNNGAEVVHFAAASMGNPHALIEMDALNDASVQRLGAALQARPELPEGVQLGFACVHSRSAISLRVYERGVGETMACGRVARAAVALLIRAGTAAPSRRVNLGREPWRG